MSARGCACPSRPTMGGLALGERRSRRARARIVPHTPEDAEPITLIGDRPGAKCRPYIRVEKDADKFAACNALADELGPIDTPKKAFKLIGEAIGDELNEVFGVVLLDIHLRLKGISETGRGEPASVMAPLMPTLQVALINGAHAVIIFHVHPSGIKAEPSEADNETTKAFVEGFDAVDVKFLDHMIIGGDSRKRSYYSYLEDKAL